MKYIDELETAVQSLAQKAEKSLNQDEAMKYSQAALNLANAIATLGSNEREDFLNNIPDEILPL